LKLYKETLEKKWIPFSKGLQEGKCVFCENAMERGRKMCGNNDFFSCNYCLCNLELCNEFNDNALYQKIDSMLNRIYADLQYLIYMEMWRKYSWLMIEGLKREIKKTEDELINE